MDGMTWTPRLAASLPALCATLACQGQPLPPSAAASEPGHADASLQRVVLEDDSVRIEETRLRGTAQRITVQSKLGGVKAYEILVAPAGRDPSQERGAAGQRAWSLFTF
jgi:hypothetical protein